MSYSVDGDQQNHLKYSYQSELQVLDLLSGLTWPVGCDQLNPIEIFCGA